jgi:hypothetical protein
MSEASAGFCPTCGMRYAGTPFCAGCGQAMQAAVETRRGRGVPVAGVVMIAGIVLAVVALALPWVRNDVSGMTEYQKLRISTAPTSGFVEISSQPESLIPLAIGLGACLLVGLLLLNGARGAGTRTAGVLAAAAVVVVTGIAIEKLLSPSSVVEGIGTVTGPWADYVRLGPGHVVLAVASVVIVAGALTPLRLRVPLR